jgi:hypothetical protein
MHLKNVVPSVCEHSFREDVINRVTYAVIEMRWRSSLRHCITSRKVAGSIPVGITEIFHWHNSSGSIVALVSTQPHTELGTRNIFWEVKAGVA